MPDAASRRDKGAVVPSRAVANGVRDLILRDGEYRAAERLAMGRQTLARLAASLPCRRSTVEVARTRLGLDGDE
jgi:hypothetical protein